MDEKLRKYFEDICGNLLVFINNVYGMEEYAFSAMTKQTKEIVSYIKKLEKLKIKIKPIIKKDNEEFIAQEKIELDNFEKLNDKIGSALYCSTMITNGEIVSLVSAYDYFIKKNVRGYLYLFGRFLH